MRIGQEEERGPRISLVVDGRDVACHAGESIAAVLLEAGVTHFRTSRTGTPRAPWCNMGTCGECYVRIDGRRRRACLVAAQRGMEVVTDG
ncbi:hypothetical protein B5C34_09055 [Pacificimonas flava]|uniref:2Fe-2S ferredoxin-type domain-containing protein n=2 Tax=Pacificimonas TaxID=1960290 RepID=A0A219B986_9SPHN|nr:MULTISPECIES: (2Fe-2S)-binding protein [Pacificimonas]MBZ6379182.1 (2Fe-2S)-binding protein [Pacificimonas aurantium]OWV34713.1 hypothetical protein B5C34_09055 [Pacificimonas flava]